MTTFVFFFFVIGIDLGIKLILIIETWEDHVEYRVFLLLKMFTVFRRQPQRFS